MSQRSSPQKYPPRLHTSGEALLVLWWRASCACGASGDWRGVVWLLSVKFQRRKELESITSSNVLAIIKGELWHNLQHLFLSLNNDRHLLFIYKKPNFALKIKHTTIVIIWGRWYSVYLLLGFGQFSTENRHQKNHLNERCTWNWYIQYPCLMSWKNLECCIKLEVPLYQNDWCLVNILFKLACIQSPNFFTHVLLHRQTSDSESMLEWRDEKSSLRKDTYTAIHRAVKVVEIAFTCQTSRVWELGRATLPCLVTCRDILSKIIDWSIVAAAILLKCTKNLTKLLLWQTILAYRITL